MSFLRPAAVLRARCAALLLVLLTAAAGTAAPAASAADEQPGRLLLMLDASGSMKGPDPTGVTKLEAAKTSLTAVVDALPDTAQVGLRVYGATVGGSSTSPEACSGTQLVAPIAPLDRAALTSAIAGFTAVGATPIAHSLKQAVADLGATGKRNLILVSDGQETCVPDPCPEVKAVLGSGIDLQVDTVGFGVDAAARTQLQCIAEAGRGSYYDAADADALTRSLTKLSQRSLRTFTISGKPVTGAVATESAPVLTPGTWIDTTELNAPKKYYAIDRAPGSTIRFSLSARPVTDVQKWNTQRFRIEVHTPQGSRCASESAYRFEAIEDLNQVITGAVRVSGGKPTGWRSECEQAPRLLVTVERNEGTASTVPVQLLVMEEPPVADVESLPEPTGRPAPDLAPATTPVSPVIGGGAFDDAPTLLPGTYSETLMPDEQLFYRVRLDFGQQLVATVDAPTPGTPPTPTFLRLRALLYTPDRDHIARSGADPEDTGTLDRHTTSLLVGGYTPTVLYRNRDASAPDGRIHAVRRSAAIAGYYYVSLSAAATLGTEQATPVTVRLRIAVNGEPNGRPTYAGSTAPAPGATSGLAAGSDTAQGPVESLAAQDTSSGPGAVPWIAAGAVVMAAAAGGVLLAVRRRGRHT